MLQERARQEPDRLTDEVVSHGELVCEMDAAHARACSAQRELFGLILQAEGREELWREDGARDLAHWGCIRCSISTWKAHRWIACAHALQGLPRISNAFETGRLGVDKVVELTRFATPSTETGLVRWANTVSGATIRRRVELESRDPICEVQDAHASRSRSMRYYDEHRRFHLEAELPAAEGAVIAKGDPSSGREGSAGSGPRRSPRCGPAVGRRAGPGVLGLDR
jgi:uncharacterized protein DUF222